jgi:hypothetical protein
MPISGGNYDLVNDVLNSVRVRLNDDLTTLQPVGGQVLRNSQPFVQWAANTAWRKLQDFLANLGYELLKEETTFLNVPATGTTDPAVLNGWNYSGYTNGALTFPSFALPANMIYPLDLWERPSGSQAFMTEMDRVLNGLPAVGKQTWNRLWAWHSDTIYLPGATVPTDIRIRFMSSLQDFLDNTPLANTPWFAQAVPVQRSLDSLSAYICAEIQVARGDAEGAMAFRAEGQDKAMLIMNRETQQPKAIYKASEFSKMRDQYTPVEAGANPKSVQR